MSDFVVSARKYRPSTFKDVVGQEALTTTLLNAIREDKLSHAYLFCGPRGVGKTSCARIFAKTINCENRTPEGEACNECSECVAANEQRSYNIFELDAASNNSVDDIRNLIDQVYIAPTTGRYRVYIIDEVHMLSSSAFNAFLKTLEEPPEHAIFILATTEKQKVLPTIISRCQVYDFNRITSQDIADHLEWVAQDAGVRAEKEALQLIAISADGGMRDALSMFDRIAGFGNGVITVEGVRKNLNLLDEDGYFALLDYIARGNHSKVLKLVDSFLRRGYDAGVVMRGFSSFLRNVLVARTPDTLSLIDMPDSIKQRLHKVSMELQPSLVWNYLKVSTSFTTKYKSSSEGRLALEVALLRMCELSHLSDLRMCDVPPSPDDLAKQVAAHPSAATPLPQPQQQAAAQPQQQVTQPQVTQPQVTQPQQQQMVSPQQRPQRIPRQTPTPQRPLGSGGQQQSAQERYGFSLTTGRSTAAHSQPETTPQPTTQRNEPFTLEQLREAWATFRHREELPVFVASAMLDHQPTFTPPYTLEMRVHSDTEEAEMRRVSDELVAYLRDAVHNDHITLSFTVVRDPQQRGPTTPTEKYDYFAKKNEWFERLSQDLNLKPYS